MKNIFLIKFVIVIQLKWILTNVVQRTNVLGNSCEQHDGIMGRCEEIRNCISNEGTFKWNKTLYLCAPYGTSIIACCRKPLEAARELCKHWRPFWEQKTNGGKCADKKPLIVGGTEATLGEFPLVAAVGFEGKLAKIKWECGGTLLSPHYVLTAAHCVNNPNYIYHVALGEHDLTRKNTNLTIKSLRGKLPNGLYGEQELRMDKEVTVSVEQYRKVIEVIVYPEYVHRYHDIALLRLEKPVTLTPRVLPACLPISRNFDLSDKLVTAMGWGRLFSGSIQTSHSRLLKVTVPTQENIDCYLNMNDKSKVTRGITSDMICAGADYKDTCQGDSGGPLLLEDNDLKSCEQLLVGVTAFGEGCGKSGLYARVSSYLDWITGYIIPKYIPEK